jgi:peptide/nickel transport system permease protein
MLAYAVRRIAVSIPVLLASTFVVFLITALSGDPVRNFATSRQPVPPQGAIDAYARRLHWNEPLVERYWFWLSGLFHGDFGPSVNPGRDLGADLLTRFGVTLRLIAAAMVLALLLAVVVGVVSAVRQYSKLDFTTTFLGFLFLAMPAFWLAVLLKQGGIWFNEQAGATIFYTIGEHSPYLDVDTAWNRFTDNVGHMILPTISLALITFAQWSRFQRGAMLEVLNSDYVRLARAKGLRPRQVLIKHSLRTALIPLTTITAIDIAQIIGTTVLTETVFQWHGMGEFLVRSINEVDVYGVLAWLLLSGTVVILFNLIADLLYAVLDPRIRYD